MPDRSQHSSLRKARLRIDDGFFIALSFTEHPREHHDRDFGRPSSVSASVTSSWGPSAIQTPIERALTPCHSCRGEGPGLLIIIARDAAETRDLHSTITAIPYGTTYPTANVDNVKPPEIYT